MASLPPPARRVAWLWDLPVRLFHWLLVGLLGFSWWSGEQHEMDWHRLSGYAIVGLLIFRVYWGFAGGRTARFAQFVKGPRAALDYVRGRYTAAPGHNPVGGWSVLALLATLTVMVGTGLFAVDVDGLESGPLSDYVSFDAGRTAAEVHHLAFNALLALVALHVVAILVYLVRRKNLIGPMIHGRRTLAGEEQAAPLGASWWKAGVGVVIAAAIAWAISKGFRFR
ncbi:cytochrome b/b6 domain-containing protein [Sphingomonas immobilis]|uniref:Cytochrome b/b6 domain-containing protein n=1 Tax=Sphingomonas immobilis TaxID=3063997 RepID=A0ABT8ZT41_9SPHN|nr:cytochrome b/b6 domain-containing protein [Sphingomonas sp. CA1-15]MDO7840735.1 cytochrome b/b6 domain-containing protein [Sphingomonas sp. CA1-15]